jgi:uncharacterized protein (UPF0261 family)
MISTPSDARLGVIISASDENLLSIGTDVAGIAKISMAILESVGKSIALSY